jgi:hypothetical protein
MKTAKITLLALAMLAITSVSKADICIEDTEGFDATACVELGGTVGTPFNNNGGPGGPSGVPLDGGASLLIVAGVGYGLKGLRNRKNKANAEKA